MSYDPNSQDAMFSRILQRLDQQDKGAQEYRESIKSDLAYIRTAVDKTNGRVNGLERWKDVVTAKTALIASIVSGGVGVAGWLIGILRDHN